MSATRKLRKLFTLLRSDGVVRTSNDLQKVLDSPHSGLVFVESVMDKYDAPIDLIVGGRALADSDYGVPGPQSAVNAQIPLPTR